MTKAPRPGRPEIGPKIDVRLPLAMVTRINQYAAETLTPRAEVLRLLIEDGMRVRGI